MKLIRCNDISENNQFYLFKFGSQLEVYWKYFFKNGNKMLINRNNNDIIHKDRGLIDFTAKSGKSHSLLFIQSLSNLRTLLIRCLLLLTEGTYSA